MKEIIVQPLSDSIANEMFANLQASKEVKLDSTVAWYDPAVGGFYISKRTIPDHILKSGRLIELVRKTK